MGIIYDMEESDFEEYTDICKKWEIRTRLDLEHDICNQIQQSNINNYFMRFRNDIFNKKTGLYEPHIELKGAMVKEPNLLDNDLPVLKNALREYFLNGIDPKDTIYNSTLLIDFQKIVKCSGKFDGVILNGKELNEKVNRIFATKDTSSSNFRKYKWSKLNWKQGMKPTPLKKWLEEKKYQQVKLNDEIIQFKGNEEVWLQRMRIAVKEFERGGDVTFRNTSKVGDTPSHARIVNTNIVETKIPEWLDLNYYYEMAISRLKSFYTTSDWKEIQKTLK